MRTIDDQFTQKTSLWQRLQRDLSLMMRIAGMTWSYFTKGRRIRKDYRIKESRGETFWVDQDFKL